MRSNAKILEKFCSSSNRVVWLRSNGRFILVEKLIRKLRKGVPFPKIVKDINPLSADASPEQQEVYKKYIVKWTLNIIRKCPSLNYSIEENLGVTKSKERVCPYCISDLANTTGLARSTISTYLSKGKLAGTKNGRFWQFSQEEFDKAVETLEGK